MGLVDFSPMFQPTPETGVARGLSQLTSVLDAIKERKSREAQAKAQLDQQRQLAAIDDARLQQQADQTAAHWEAENERLKAKDDQESTDKALARAEKATPSILQALKDKDPIAAQLWAQNASGKVGVAPRTTVPENAVGDMLNGPPPAPQGPNLSALPGPFSLLGAAQMAQQGARQASESDPLEAPPVPQAPPVAQTPQGPVKYRVEMPGQPPLDFDPEEARRLAIQQGGQAAQDIAGARSPSPFHQQALDETQSLVSTGQLKPAAAVEHYTKRLSELDHIAASERNAARQAGARNAGQNLVHPPGELDFLDEKGNKIGTTRSPEEGRKFREGRDALVGIKSAIADLKSHVLAHGRTDIGGVIPIEGGEVRGQREALISNVTDYLTTLKNTGVLNGNEYTRYVNLLGTNIMRGGKAAAAVLNEIENGSRTHYYSHSGSARAKVPAASAPAAADPFEEAMK